MCGRRWRGIDQSDVFESAVDVVQGIGDRGIRDTEPHLIEKRACDPSDRISPEYILALL